MNETLPAYYISHGGGPWPWMRDEQRGVWDKLDASLRAIPRELGRRPKAVLVISAHWERREFTVMSHPQPPMIYDYSGFPEKTYEIQYPAPGDPELAARVVTLLSNAGIAVHDDPARGFDHGVYAPFFAIYPHADVRIVQLSLKTGLDPHEHMAVGRALAALRDEDVLIVGSGFSFHNLRLFGEAGRAPSREFDAWLTRTMSLAPQERYAQLLSWDRAPSARLAHAREEHLAPLFVALGSAYDQSATKTYHETEFMSGITVSSFRFGNVGF